MNRLSTAVVALIAVATSLDAQTTPPLRAFPRAVGATVGITSFNTRSTDAGASFSYKGSVLISGKLDVPMTRRTGLLISTGIAPLSQQRGTYSASTVISGRLMLGIADAAVGFRFKPSAPVFFAGGGGITYATKPAIPQSTGSVMEPHALFAIGYDTKSDGAWNVRSVWVNRLVFVGDDRDAATVDETTAYDWSLEIGFRYLLGRRSIR